MDQRASYPSIQALRGMAALLVVMFHLRIVEGKYGAGDLLLPAWVRFADGGVDLFFVISGFIIATITRGQYRSAANAGRFLYRRLWRVVPPYWAYTTLVVVLMLVVPGMVNSAYGEQSIVKSYLLWPQAELPVLTVGWTLVHEVYFYLVVAAIMALASERLLPACLVAWATIVIMAQTQLGPAAPPWVSLVFNAMTLEFIGGALVGLYWHRLPSTLSLALLPVGLLAFAAGMCGLDFLSTDYPAIDSHGALQRTLVFGTASLLIVAGAVAWQARRGDLFPGALHAIGDSSYSLYLSHVFVVSAAGRLWQMSGQNREPWQHALFLLLTVMACVVFAMVSYRLLERPLLRVGRDLLRKPALNTDAMRSK